MQKLIETLNNLLKLITTLAILAVLGGLVYGGYWVYCKVTEVAEVAKDKVTEVGEAVKNFDPSKMIPKIEPKIDMSGLFGGKKEEKPKTEFEKTWMLDPEDRDFPAPKNAGCQHTPKCSNKNQHLLSNMRNGTVAGKWAE